MSALAPTLQAFFTERLVRQRRASPHTIAAYRDTFRLLLGFVSECHARPPSRLGFEDLDATMITAFLDHLEDDRHNSARTRNARLAAIRSLFRYAALRHPDHADLIGRVLAVPQKRQDKALVSFLTHHEIDALLEAPDPSTWEGRRDRALMLVAAQAGLRVSELADLDCADVALGAGAYIRCHGKWRWGPGDVEEWTVSLRSAGRAHSTIRAYHNALAMFMGYVCDARYGWVAECEERFGTHPVQVCTEWNMAGHVADYEGDPGRRPFTRAELQLFFDHADEAVAAARARGRKGWLAAWRDSALFKVTYAWGLRRREASMLDVADFAANPAAPELGRFGMLAVRYGKAMRGSPPRRRNVATVMPWAVEAVEEYLAEVRPCYGGPAHPAMWLTERGGRIGVRHMNERFAAYRDALGLASELSPHCLRHAYVSHLVEDGVDPLFVQQQVGHSWASTTAVYTSVSSDYRNRVMREALSRAFDGPAKEGGA